MTEDIPQKFKSIGIAQLIAGVVNVFIGWGLSFTFWTFGGTIIGTCLAVVTLGLCPFGYFISFCGFFSFLIIPLGMVEAIVGLLALTNPESVKKFLPFLPFVQIPAFLLGDIASPIAGIVTFMMARDPEVKGYIDG